MGRRVQGRLSGASIRRGELESPGTDYRRSVWRRSEATKGNELVSQGRFELPTFPLGGGCSIQLSY